MRPNNKTEVDSAMILKSPPKSENNNNSNEDEDNSIMSTYDNYF